MDTTTSFNFDLSAMSSDNLTLDEADAPASRIMPEKSKLNYESAYKKFKDWCQEENIDSLTEDVLLTYLEEKSKTRKPTTLWTTYSMLKTTLRIKDGVDINRFKRLTLFLKRKSRGYRAEKLKILTAEQINKFIYEADNKKYLLLKIVLIMGTTGRCSRDELVRMTVDDIEDRGPCLVVRVPDSKLNNEFRTFTIIDLYHIELYRKYADLRPALASNRRFFYKYINGRCFNQVVGINKIGTIPSLIAKYFNLPNPKGYSAHCFRKRSVAGSTSRNTNVRSPRTDYFATTIKREKSETPPPVSEEYGDATTPTEDPVEDKIEICNKILEFEISDSNVHVTQRDKPSTSRASNSSCDSLRATLTSSGINIGTCNNCTINFNIVKK